MNKQNHLQHPPFTLQWHVTVKCTQNCVHCYIGRRDPSYLKELTNELDYAACTRVIDDYVSTFNAWRLPVQITFTGGDPLLRKDFNDLIRYAQRAGVRIGILGNPNRVDPDTARELHALGVELYQLSLDGMQNTHDALRRKPGLFDKTIAAAKLLDEVGIRSTLMFTVHRLNAAELPDLIRFVAGENLPAFDFARLVPTGSGRDLTDQMLTPEEYHALLLQVLEVYQSLEKKGCRTRFGRKDHLWTLLYQELGLLRPMAAGPRRRVEGGCGLGWQHLTVLADGRVVACRRLPVEIGQVPQQSLREIFIRSHELNQIRQIDQLDKCRRCDLLAVCRGCPAVAYGLGGDYRAPDPQCWKQL